MQALSKFHSSEKMNYSFLLKDKQNCFPRKKSFKGVIFKQKKVEKKLSQRFRILFATNEKVTILVYLFFLLNLIFDFILFYCYLIPS